MLFKANRCILLNILLFSPGNYIITKYNSFTTVI